MKKITLILALMMISQPILPTVVRAYSTPFDATSETGVYETEDDAIVDYQDEHFDEGASDNENYESSVDKDDATQDDGSSNISKEIMEDEEITAVSAANLLPQFAHATPEIAQEEANIRRLIWNTIRNRYEVTLSDSAAMSGNQILSYFLTLETGANSLWFAPGLRVERTGLNAIRVYATDSTNPSTSQFTSSAGLLQRDGTSIFFTVEVKRRPAFAEATMISDVTGNPLPGAVFELQRRNPTDTDWNPIVGMQTGVADEYGIVLFEGLTHGRRYRIREISVPAPYV